MQAVQLDVNVLDLFHKLFSDVKNKVYSDAEMHSELNKVVGNVPMHVLLADDDDDDFDFFSDAMNFIVPNAKISRAKDGHELFLMLKKLGNNLPSIIFLDLNMPCKNGFECLQMLKTSENWKAIPVIIYSTSANIDEIEQTYKHGANLYIQKPHSFGDIKTIIKKVFSVNMHDLAFQPLRDKYFITA